MGGTAWSPSEPRHPGTVPPLFRNGGRSRRANGATTDHGVPPVRVRGLYGFVFLAFLPVILYLTLLTFFYLFKRDHVRECEEVRVVRSRREGG